MIPDDFEPPPTITFQRLMPDGSISEVEILITGTARLHVGRAVGDYFYRDGY